jgi:hypothetical protein
VTTESKPKKRGRRPRVPEGQGYARIVNKRKGVRYLEVGLPFNETGEVDVIRLGQLKSKVSRGRAHPLTAAERSFAGYLLAVTIAQMEERYGIRTPYKAALRMISDLRVTAATAADAGAQAKAARLLHAMEKLGPGDDRPAKMLARMFRRRRVADRRKP